MKKSLLLAFIAVSVLILTGCPARTVIMADGTEISESGYIALESTKAKKETNKENIGMLLEGIQDCSALSTKDERAECEHSNQLWMGQIPWLAQSMNNGGVDAGYWQLVNAREARKDPLRWIDAVGSVAQTMCLTGIAPWSCAAYGSQGGGMTIKADRGSTITGVTGITGNKSHHTRGDGNLSGYGSALAQDEGTSANRDGQNQFGNGNQAQAQTDPPNLQQTEGDVSVDSGTGISTSLP